MIIAIASCSIEVRSLGSWPNNKKYSEKDAKEVHRLNLYFIFNHGSYKSQLNYYGPFGAHISPNLNSLSTPHV